MSDGGVPRRRLWAGSGVVGGAFEQPESWRGDSGARLAASAVSGRVDVSAGPRRRNTEGYRDVSSIGLIGPISGAATAR